MLEKIRVIFTIPELRRKILFTLIMLAVYRVGWQISVPAIDQSKLATNINASNNLFRTVATFAGSNLSNYTIFGLGIMPYISASIILQLLGTFWKPIEQLQKEGEAGRKKINQYTRLLTVVLCLIQSWMYVTWLNGPVNSSILNSSEMFSHISAGADTQMRVLNFGWHINTVLIMTAGTVFLMWLGEQIDEYGIGNGISLLIMANIISSLPGAILSSAENFTLQLGGDGQSKKGIELVIAMLIIFFLIVMGVVLMTLGQRRIPMQSAKHVRGNRMYGGTKEFLPLKVNQSGVMPIIFASSLMMIPTFLVTTFQNYLPNVVVDAFDMNSGARGGLVYNLVFIAMIFFFCYFWTAISFNPKEIAENLKESGSFIPGQRPGSPTAAFLEKVMVRITFVGAFFLSIVAILPTLVSSQLQLNPNLATFYGGTSLLIAVSVAFDLVQKIDSYLVMRNYKGLLQ